MAAESLITYTGQKIKKVKWLPKQTGELDQSSVFITGSYDDEINSITVWQYYQDAESMEGEESGDTGHTQLSLTEPRSISSYDIPASLTDMKFIDSNHLGACLLNGSLEILRYYPGRKLESRFKMDCLHSLECPCTCIATNQFSPGTVYTGGVDGSVNVVIVDQQKRVGTLGTNETTCINSMVCTSRNELLVGCSSGQMKLWDFREKSQSPSMTYNLTTEMTSLQCLDKHPSQSHLIVAGFSNGCICFRDMRHGKRPVNIMTAHSGVVWEVRFHPIYPNYLFSCSQDGSLWQWNAMPTSRGVFDSSILSTPGVTMDTTQQWLTTPTSGSLDVSTVIDGKGNSLSVNSFDIEYKHLVGVTDQEAMYLIPNQIL